MNTYYQVVARDSGKLVVLENHIKNYQTALQVVNEFLMVLPFVDGDFTDVQVYTIHM